MHVHDIIIIINEFHRDASLKENFRAADRLTEAQRSTMIDDNEIHNAVINTYSPTTQHG